MYKCDLEINNESFRFVNLLFVFRLDPLNFFVIFYFDFLLNFVFISNLLRLILMASLFKEHDLINADLFNPKQIFICLNIF